MEKIVAVRLGNVSEGVEPGAATQEDRVLPEAEGDQPCGADQAPLLGRFRRSSQPECFESKLQGTDSREHRATRSREAVDGISKDAGLTVAPLPMELIEDIPYEPNPMG